MPAGTIPVETAKQLVANCMIDSPDQARQLAAARALAQQRIRDPELHKLLKSALDKVQQGLVREPLAHAYAASGKMDPAMLNRALQKMTEDSSARVLIESFGKDAAGPLGRAIPNLPKNGAWAAIEMLGKLGADAEVAVPDLVAQLAKPRDQWFAAHTCRTLGKIGPGAKAAVPALVRVATTDGYADARCAAAWALGEIGDRSPGTKTALEAVAEDKTETVATEAKEALKKLSKQE